MTILSTLTTSCGLLPKTVEYGQSKVKAAPGKKPETLEAEKQGAEFFHREVVAARDAALAAGVAGLSSVGRLSVGTLKNGFEQVVKGVESFKESVEASHLSEEAKAWIKDSLARHQNATQSDPKVQDAVKSLTK